MTRIALVLSGFLIVTLAHAASFDCDKAQSNYDKLVCADSNLGMLDQGMSDVYHQVLALSPNADKKAIVINQRKWIALVSKQLQEKISENMPENDLKVWLDTALHKSIAGLRSKIKIGGLVVIDKTPMNTKVCSVLLSRRNMCSGTRYTTDCTYGLKLPDNFSIPDWNSTQANFDFDNQGRPVDVFSVDVDTTHIVVHYYIVADPQESKAIRARLNDAVGVNDQLDLMDDFKIVGPNQRNRKHPPRFSSRLFEAGFSPVYGGQGSARSQIVLFHNSTYIAATATNDFIPTFVLFRPSKTALEPVCYNWVSPPPWDKTETATSSQTIAKKTDPKHTMMQAITNNDIETVKKLLGDGIQLPEGAYSFTPLDIAARNNNPEMLSFLLDNGANPEGDIESMKGALKTCNMKMVSLLVDHGYKVKGNPSYYGPYDPLPWAALFGCTDIIKYFVSKGADIKSSNPLRHAVMLCHVETVRYLLSKGIEPDSTDMEYTPLWYAAINAVNLPKIRGACKSVISDLLQAGANPDRALEVSTTNPALKLPRNDDEIMKLLQSRSKTN